MYIMYGLVYELASLMPQTTLGTLQPGDVFTFVQGNGSMSVVTNSPADPNNTNVLFLRNGTIKEYDNAEPVTPIKGRFIPDEWRVS